MQKDPGLRSCHFLCADAPQVITDGHLMALAVNYLDTENKRPFVAGMRELAMDRHTLSTMGRIDEARQKRICQQIPFDYPAASEREPGVSMQPLWITAYSMDYGKRNAGNSKDYQVAPWHVNVSTCLLLTVSSVVQIFAFTEAS